MPTSTMDLTASSMPASFQEKLKMAELFIRSSLMPRGFDTPEKLLIALEMGHELGIPPLMAIMNIAVINNQPTLKADMMVALAQRSDRIDDIRIEYQGNEHANDDNFGCRVTIKRKGIQTPFTAMFTRRDAKVAGLYFKENWKKYEHRMLKHRATAFCIRDALPEVFAGIYIPEELEDTQSSAIESVIPVMSEEPELSSDPVSLVSVDPEPEPSASPQQLKAIHDLSSKLFSHDIMQSFVYDVYQVNRMEQLSSSQAGEIILMLQNYPGTVHEWIENNYHKPAEESA